MKTRVSLKYLVNDCRYFALMVHAKLHYERCSYILFNKYPKNVSFLDTMIIGISSEKKIS